MKKRAGRRFASIILGILAVAAAVVIPPPNGIASASGGDIKLELHVTPSTSVYGNAVELHAFGEDWSGSCIFVHDCDNPTGLVTFYDQYGVVAAAPMVLEGLYYTGDARVTVNFLEPGVHQFYAIYHGNFDSEDTRYEGQYISIETTVDVLKRPCSLLLEVNRNLTSNENTNVVFTADLTGTGHSGTIDFLDDQNRLLSRTTVQNGGPTTWSIPVNYLYPNSITVHAQYYGDGHNDQCTSEPRTHSFAPNTTATGSVTVPEPENDSYTIDQDSVLVADVVVNDAFFGHPSTPRLPTQGEVDFAPDFVFTSEHGTLQMTPDDKVQYTPTPGFQGTDKFSYYLERDGTTTANHAVVFVTVQCALGLPDAYSVEHDFPLTVDGPGVLANDAGKCDGAATVVAPPTHGSVALDAAGGFEYTPTTGYGGPDSFTYSVANDPSHRSVAVALDVSGTACVPLLVGDSFDVVNGVLDAAAPGVAANDTLCRNTVVVDVPPQHGTLELGPTGDVSYRAVDGYSGPDTFTYAIDVVDPMPTAALTLASAPSAVVTLNVSAVPVATTTDPTTVTATSLPPAATPPGAPAPAATPSSPAGIDELPATGSNSLPIALLAAMLLPVGAGLARLARRRRPASSDLNS